MNNFALYFLMVLTLALETQIISRIAFAVKPEVKAVDRSFAVIDVEFGNYLVWCYDNRLKPGHADSLMIYLNEDELENMLIEVMLDERGLVE